MARAATRTALVRIAVGASFLLGCALSAMGVVGDVQGWWENLPFSTNLLSSAAAALIGFPIALLIVDRLASNYQEDTQERQLRNQAVGLIRQMRSELSSWCPEPEQLPALEELLRVSFRVPTPRWVVDESLTRWKKLFPVSILERSPRSHEGVIASTLPDWQKFRETYYQLMQLRSSYQVRDLPWPDEGKLNNGRSILDQLISTDAANNFRMAAMELMRLDADRPAVRPLSPNEMANAITPIISIVSILIDLEQFFQQPSSDRT